MPADSVIFPSLQEAAEDEQNVIEIESYCVHCEKDGTTRLLLTEIPFFKQVVLMSFECPHCNYKNNELQPAQEIALRGVRFELAVKTMKDLTRQVVKTEWAQVKIPEIEFEVKHQSGLITTVEGLLDRAITGLQYSYDHSNADQESKGPLAKFIEKMLRLKEGKEPFTLIIEDISGNSFVENFLAPQSDPQLEVAHFIRTIEDDKLLGIYSVEAEDGDVPNQQQSSLRDEVLQFPTNCHHCNAPCFTNMKLTKIPHYKEVIIMATNCDVCGHRTNEIKSGAGMEEKGVRITMQVKEEADLKKEVVRSDTCDISIPELDLTLNSTGSGRYTTIEGLGLNMIDDLQGANPFIDGDSSREEIKRKIELLTNKLKNLVGHTIILDDPCGNSYMDGATSVEHYQRTWEQNEELGINDLKTENYQPNGASSIPEEDEDGDVEEISPAAQEKKQ